jgi:asparagine synthase (glutamine-hydrolysing)
MCGIAGIWTAASHADTTLQTLRAMSAAIVPRGPDDDGCWFDTGAGLALAHRRLSIVDLSPLGHQPMASASGRYVIVFNGEVYNHGDLRQELVRSGRCVAPFRGTSDTEVMLAAIETYGLRAAVQRFVGMFAFALWDSHERQLHLVRDRLGIKPLYYGWAGRNLVFSSELKALIRHPDCPRDIDRDALALFMRYNCIPAPHSIYRGIFKLKPATILTFRSPLHREPQGVEFWSATAVAAAGVEHPFTGSEEEAAARLESLLREAVGLRMIADVPLGAFLSGGIDSSTVVALMQAQSVRPVRTFSIGSPDAEYDEAGHARAVAQHLGTAHTELYVTAREALDVIPHLPTIYDEPFSDSSQIPTLLVSKLARQHVTVALSGDGGDELFGGYNRHVWGRKIWNVMRRVPAHAREAPARALTAVPPLRWNRLFETAAPFLPRALRHQAVGDKLHKLAGILSAPDADALYVNLASHWSAAEPVVLGTDAARLNAVRPPRQLHGDDLTSRMLFADLVTYLPDDILTKVDRASMAVSLEARVPLLDHRVVEFAWQLPVSMKVRGSQGKWLLRQVLHRYVPPALIDRPKAGFGIPIGEWLRGPLRPWAEAHLDRRRLEDEGFFDATLIRDKWVEHLSGRRNWPYHLWDVLMFQAWHASQRSADRRGVPSEPSVRAAAV